MIRRALLLVLMLLLPMQWSWSVAASVCSHEIDGAHFGHHEHRQCSAAGAGDPASADAQLPDPGHPDCQTCHGAGVACVDTPSERTRSASLGSFGLEARHAVPEPPLERLLRPPLSPVA